MTTKLVSGNSAATVPSAVPHEKPGHDDRVVALGGEAAERLLALGVVLQLEVDVSCRRFGLPRFGAVEGGFVEGFVELAAEVIDDGRIGERRASHQRDERCARRKL